MRRTTRWASLALALLVLLAACAAGGNEGAGTASGQPGFWLGLWHGVISPITFLVSLFRDDVGIYEVANSGGWYDFGFLFGASIAFGGSARSGGAARRRGASRGRGQ